MNGQTKTGAGQGLIFAPIALSALLFSVSAGTGAAQSTTSATPRVPLILVPYGEPGSGDPHAAEVTAALNSELTQNGVALKPLASIDHLDAVANASGECRSNGASGLFIAEGRYEQTMKTVQIPFLGQVISYPTHVELRLDQIDCSGKVIASKTAACNESRSGVMFNPTNVGSIIDDCFRKTAHDVAALTIAAPASGAAVSEITGTGVPVPVAPPAAVAQTYALIPFEQPGIADPRAPDMTRSLALAMTNRKLAVKVDEPIDRLTAVSNAAAICAHLGATVIVVPEARVEQTQKTHGELRLSSVSCDGHIVAHALNTADVAPSFFSLNPGASLVQVTERASSAALDQLLSGTPIPAVAAGTH